MKYRNQISFKRRPSHSNGIIPKSTKSRKTQMIPAEHLIFPSGFLDNDDTDDQKDLKKFKMKIYLVVMSIEGYLNNFFETTSNNYIQFNTTGPAIDRITTIIKKYNNKYNKKISPHVYQWVDKIVKLRLFSVKEGEPGENTAAKIQNATNKLNEIHGELKKWHPESGEKLEKQNDIVIKSKGPLILDFRRVSHVFSTKNWVRNLIEGLKKARGTTDEDQLRETMERLFKEAGQKSFQEDKAEAKNNSNRKNLGEKLLNKFNATDKNATYKKMTKQQLNNIGNTKRVYRNACSSNPSEKKNKTYNKKNNESRHGNGGYKGGYNYNNQGRKPNPDFKKRRRQPTNPTGPKSSGRKRKLPASDRELEHLESKIARYKKNIAIMDKIIQYLQR